MFRQRKRHYSRSSKQRPQSVSSSAVHTTRTARDYLTGQSTEYLQQLSRDQVCMCMLSEIWSSKEQTGTQGIPKV